MHSWSVLDLHGRQDVEWQNGNDSIVENWASSSYKDLYRVHELDNLFTRHIIEWIDRSLETFNKEVVWEFYAIDVVTLRGSLERRSKPVKPDSLIEVVVRGYQVDISSTSIRCFLYGVSTSAARVTLTLEFDYRRDMVNGGQFQQSIDSRESTRR